jgi:hypothetical protein
MTIDYKAAALAAYRAKISYLDPEAMNALYANNLDKTCLGYNVFDGVIVAPKYYHDSESGATAYSWIQQEILHIVFRGTDGALDMRIDAEELRVPLFEGRDDILVHAGFLKQFKSLEGQLLETILEQKVTTGVHFSGHSLGGALATLASGVFSRQMREMGMTVGCYTIGSPRVGGSRFVKWWNGLSIDSYRILNYRDPVPMVPMNWLYTHIHGGIRLEDTGSVTILGTDRWLLGRLITCLCHFSCCNAIHSHGCDTYIGRLLELADWKALY